ncbi:DUF3267 domain-containing protein [Lysinibacillus louembei]|uniref:DUF3267 domain-containing protein n=1 Tax=Lysinibacillus louembei TaxID=1470088 RepID=A0ABZ0S3L3_9BACI|nr:DUF3267 domain-containing protein [Lysinibacillus louembei]WPK13939.1 DUF3267 domain-containing protein [Lysinibacillus louembei]
MQQPKIVELNMPKIAKLNIWLTIILVITFTIVYKIMYGQTNFSFLTMLVVAVLYIIFIVLHEAFHLIGFMMFGGAKFKELDYGINLKLGIAYATTVKPLTNSAMKKALLLPFWTTGVFPTILGFYIESFAFVLTGALLIAGAVGDFAMYKELRKFPNNVLVKDDPQLPKLYIVENSFYE